MRRLWYLLLAIAIGAILWTVLPAGAATTVFREVANTFTALQTFRVPGATTYVNTGTAQMAPWQIDFAMTNPTSGPTAGTIGSVGSCPNGDTVRLYVTAVNQSGETSASPASSDVLITSASKAIVANTRPTLPTGSTFWRLLWTKLSEGHAIYRFCATTYNAAATTTANCGCGSTTVVPANTTAPVTMTDLRDGEFRFASGTPSSTVPQFTPGGNRAYFYGTGPEWTWDSGTTREAFLMGGGGQLKQVCKVGCQYSTIGAAVAAITDASSTKRYTVLIAPGDYDESVTTKSYVYFVGEHRAATRVRSTTQGVGAFVIPADVTEVGISNLTTGGAGVYFPVGSTVPTRAYIQNCNLGIIDGTGGPAGVATHCIWDDGSLHEIYSSGNICRSNNHMLEVSVNSRMFSNGDTFIGETGGVILADTFASTARLEINSAIAYFTDSGSGDLPIRGILTGFPLNPGTIIVKNSSITISTTNASRTAASYCFQVDANNAAEVASLEIDNTDCRIVSTSSSGAIAAMKVVADTDHSATTLAWHVGRIAVSGGATRYDVDNAETVAGFSLTISDVVHAGLYNGAGTTTIRNGLITDGKVRNSPLATAPATCSIGDTYADTSGAYCACSSANTWSNTIGVGSCV